MIFRPLPQTSLGELELTPAASRLWLSAFSKEMPLIMEFQYLLNLLKNKRHPVYTEVRLSAIVETSAQKTLKFMN